MTTFCLIDQSGRIIGLTEANDVLSVPWVTSDIIYEAFAYPHLDYFDITDPAVPVKLARPALNSSLDKATVIADGVDLATITCPQSTVDVTITGPVSSQFTDADGVIGLTFDFPGDYVVTVEAWPALKEEYTIVAT